ncbi:MAG: SDR family oxidoreductase [Candidatus Bathyarchaeia archaeon]
MWEKDKSEFENQVVVVVGGGGGIGSAIAEAFAERKAKVIICSRNVKKLEEIAEKIRVKTNNPMVETMEVDVTSEDSIKQLAERIASKYGKVDVLINAHGALITALSRRPFLETTIEDWEYMMNINARGVWLTCREFAKIMVKNNKGKIINISSQAGSKVLRGALDNAGFCYAVSKATVDQITRAFAIQLVDYNINVNAIAPGWVETEELLKRGPEAIEMRKRLIPKGRLCKPEEVAELAVFLASSAADYITGQVIYIDGGVSAIYGSIQRQQT